MQGHRGSHKGNHRSSGQHGTDAVKTNTDWRVIQQLWPYMWAYKWRVVFAMACLIAAKLANVGVPVLLKTLVDGVNVPPAQLLIFAPLGIILAYGALRLSTSLFTELREFLFVRVTQSTMRVLARKTFAHLHNLSIRFHINRRTGQVTREIDQGVRGISSMVSFTLYSIVPTMIELALVIGYLAWHYEIWFAIIVVAALVAYISYTFKVTNWRIGMRRTWNDLETRAQSQAVDSLLNFETVKYFGNEAYETARYDKVLEKSETAAMRSQQSLHVLNAGQQLIIAIALTLLIWRAIVGVQAGRMTVGDLVLVNAFLIQLFIPLNFLGVIYREIKQAMTDMERMFKLLGANQEVKDAPNAQPLILQGAAIAFEHVVFSYDVDGADQRQILSGVSLNIPAGTSCAVVGSSGAGKSTLSRLLFRFYEIQNGSITIDGQDISLVTQASLRAAIGIVPQDTVLFNDTIGYNIAYGKPNASQAEIEAAARAAQIHDFIASLPQGYNTVVGERGLKLSGGEKQRVAIARTVLKNPPILVLDEATSALDSETEAAIQAQLKEISKNRTTLIIAHRLSTIAEADQIVVLEAGRVVEQGSFEALLAQQGRFASMWAMQAAE